MARAGGYRVLIVGAGSLRGKELATALRDRRFPSRTLQLVEDASPRQPGAATSAPSRLVELDDEAEILRPWSEEAFAEADVIFLCGTPAGARAAIEASTAAPIIDLTGGIEAEGDVAIPLIGWGATAGVFDAGSRRVASVTHPAAQALARLAVLAARAGAIDGLVATVFEPASERGLEAIREMEKQTLQLLGARSLPSDVFGAQVVFTLRADLGTAAQPSLPEIRRRIARELHRLLSADPPLNPVSPVTIELLHAPQFHASMISMYVRFRIPPAPGALDSALRASDVRLYGADEQQPDATAVAGEDAIHLGAPRLDADHPNAVWLFAACDNLRRTALSAVDGALRILDGNARR